MRVYLGGNDFAKQLDPVFGVFRFFCVNMLRCFTSKKVVLGLDILDHVQKLLLFSCRELLDAEESKLKLMPEAQLTAPQTSVHGGPVAGDSH